MSEKWRSVSNKGNSFSFSLGRQWLISETKKSRKICTHILFLNLRANSKETAMN